MIEYFKNEYVLKELNGHSFISTSGSRDPIFEKWVKGKVTRTHNVYC